MSNVDVTPDLLKTAAVDLENVGSRLDDVQRAAASATQQVAPAAADEVSQGIAQLFGEHAQAYYAAAQQAAAYQDRFVQTVKAGAVSYASAEDFNAALFNTLDSIRFASGGGLFLAGIAYAAWAQSWALLLPDSLQTLALLPAGLFIVGAFASAVFWIGIETALASVLGYP